MLYNIEGIQSDIAPPRHEIKGTNDTNNNHGPILGMKHISTTMKKPHVVILHGARRPKRGVTGDH